jgi:hypothetical protein
MKKHMFFASFSAILMLFGSIWAIYPIITDYFPYIHDPVDPAPLFVPIDKVMKTIGRKSYYTRFTVDLSPSSALNQAGFLITIPAIGVYLFLFFGVGKEARKMYQDRFRGFVRLLQWARRAPNDQDTNDPKQPILAFLPSSWRGLPLLNRKPVITPFELPVVVPYPHEIGSRAIAKVPYQPPQPEPPRRKIYPVDDNSTPAPNAALVQAPPPAYVPVPSPSKRRH